MKNFKRIEPTEVQEIGARFKRKAVIKRFETEDGLQHEFTTIYEEGTQAAAVIALTVMKKVITVFQFRPGHEKWVYDLPGGGVYKGEDPEVAAVRELREETGYTPGTIEYLGNGCFDAYTNITCHYYFATDCVFDSAGASLDEEEDDQGAEVRLLEIAELIEQAKYGFTSDPRAVLQAYEKLKELEES